MATLASVVSATTSRSKRFAMAVSSAACAASRFLPQKSSSIAGAERGRIVDDLAPAIGQATGTRARGAGIGLLTRAAEARQQRRARDARLRVGLDEARGGRGDVQIDSLGFLHQVRQFRRTKAAPPIQRRRRVPAGQPRGLVPVGNVERRIGQILGQNAAGGTGDQAKRRKPSRRTTTARDRSRQALMATRGGDPVLTSALRRAKSPASDRCENRRTNSRMTLVGAGCDTFTAVMFLFGT